MSSCFFLVATTETVMTPSLNCVAPVTMLQCPTGAPVTTAPAVTPTPTATTATPASGATQMGEPVGASQRDAAAAANADPIALLAEAVDQLRLAVAALQQSTGRDREAPASATSATSAKAATGNDRRISALAQAIRETQGDVGELLASRSFGPSGPGLAYGSFAQPRANPGSSPFADASFTDAGSFFSQETREPDF